MRDDEERITKEELIESTGKTVLYVVCVILMILGLFALGGIIAPLAPLVGK